MTHPLYVAFVWHQHQPNYRDPSGGPAYLPWVRLHAAKDYLHMAELVADFPAIHCTFNFVPSLVEQLVGIGEGRYTDKWQLLSLKEAWTPEEKQFLRDHFFSIHPRLLERYPAYVRLRDRRNEPDLPDAYYLDLAAWFNLAWIDARAIARDETLREMVDKAQNFTPADVAAIIGKHRELAARVIPFHRELAARGQIELSVSPYYHPILPLLANQRSAHEALPSLPLPATLFAHPEDAAEQIRRAVDAHHTYFGAEPAGLWPSEGSVSEDLLDTVGGTFRWLASDEEILARSLGKSIGRDGEGNVTNPRVLYQPYGFAKPGATRTATALIFRDHVISDRIGFAFQFMSARDAAGEMVYRLNRIRERIADSEHGYLVSIILDGENAWESYEDNGDPFFRELYTAISNDSWLRSVTIGEYLRENPPREKLKR
ncbi:MAG TPA: glycoside hydrolase family 57 protein, partial [Anaerolineae bacterium]